MNYVENDYVLGHIVFEAWQSGESEVLVDLLSGETNDTKLVTPQGRESINRYVAWLPDLVARSNSDPEFLAKAELLVTVGVEVSPVRAQSKLFESPYTCTVGSIDDRAKSHLHEIEGWWYLEQLAPRHIRELRVPAAIA